MASKYGTDLHELARRIESAAEERLKEIGAQIAKQIKEIREEAALSQYELSRMLGTGQSRISQMEDAEYGKLSLSTLAKVAESLGCELIVELRNKNARSEHLATEEVPKSVKETVETLLANAEQVAEALKFRPNVKQLVGDFNFSETASQENNEVAARQNDDTKWVA